MDIYFCPFFKLKKEFQKNKKIFRFFSIPKIAFLVFQYIEMSLFGGCFGIFLQLLFKKNEWNCYLFAHRK